jgi:hypothetical protein
MTWHSIKNLSMVAQESVDCPYLRCLILSDSPRMRNFAEGIIYVEIENSKLVSLRNSLCFSLTIMGYQCVKFVMGTERET